MMSYFESMDVILGIENTNPIERDLSDVIGNSENFWNIESNSQFRGNQPQGNDFGQYGNGGTIPRQNRFEETKETFFSEFKMRLSQEMDSMMFLMHSQINRAITSTITGRVIPEIQNIVSSMSSSGNKDSESGLSPDNQEIREDTNGFKSKITKKYCRSAIDLNDNRDRSPFT